MTPAEHARLIDKQEFEEECQAVRRRALGYSKQRRREERARIRRWIETPIAEVVTTGHTAEQRERIQLKAAKKGCRQPKLYTINGETKSITEWAIAAGISYNAMRRRLERLEGSPLVGEAFAGRYSRRGRETALHTVDGVSKTLQQWADHIGISYTALHARLNRGHTLAEAVATPSGPHLYTVNGVTKTLNEWAIVADCEPQALRMRLHSGIPLETAIALKRGERAGAKTYTAYGVTKTLRQWADDIGISPTALYGRMRSGRTLEEALAMPAGRHAVKAPGVPSDFEASKGTGAGRNAQATSNITFEETAE